MTHQTPERLWTRDFILLSTALFLISTAFYILLPTLPVYVVKEMGLTNKEVGLIVAVYTLAAFYNYGCWNGPCQSIRWSNI